jgi:hypothetical protein
LSLRACFELALKAFPDAAVSLCGPIDTTGILSHLIEREGMLISYRDAERSRVDPGDLRAQLCREQRCWCSGCGLGGALLR